MKQTRIYLDAAAGAANPSGLYKEGAGTARILAKARQKVADFLGAASAEIIFTGGGTESNNLAIFGLRPKHLITTAIEHASVREPAKKLRTTFLPVDGEGFVDLEKLKKLLRRETTLVSVIYAHNEIGVIQPAREIAKIVRNFKKAKKLKANSHPYLHLDACQAPRYLDLNVQKLGADLLTLNGAKLGVPGVGCLFVRKSVDLKPIIFGGGQENGRRSGTENVRAVVLFAKALEKCARNREKENKRVSRLRDYFIDRVLKIPGAELNGSRERRLPNNINVSFCGLDGEQMVLELDAQGVACSTGAACNLPARDASYVIMALGRTRAEALSAVRFTLTEKTTKGDLNYVLKVLPLILQKLNRVKNLNKIV